MRAFILLSLIAVAAADISGYNYGRQAGGRLIGSSILSGSIQPNIQQQIIQHNPQVLQQVQQGQQVQHVQHVPQVVQEVNKEFYTYSAPEEEFHDPQVEQQVSSVTKKNLQVIFIHAPEQTGLNRAVHNLAQQTLEQQTAIYVLTKQADLSNLAQTLQRESSHVAHKPEVHFIKYRTQEDAARAQQSIREQYDSLGGSSSNSDEGVAPVINFASQQHVHQQPNIGSGSIGGIGGSIGGIGSSVGSIGGSIGGIGSSLGSIGGSIGGLGLSSGSSGGSIPSIGGIGGTQQIIAPSQNYLPIRT